MLGHIFVICGPSGVGKGTLINRLLDEHPHFVIPSSYTTRPPRLDEGTRKKYHFVSREEFMSAVNQKKILEYEEEHGYLYGTDKESLDRALQEDRTILFDIEPRGALTLKKLFSPNVTIIFIAPPSLESLRHRILDDPRRANMSSDELDARLATAKREIEFAPQGDHIILNEDNRLDESYKQLIKIIHNTQ